jgi:hypothetical protein
MGSIIRGLVARLDLALWDGVTKTVTRADATGGNVTGLTIGEYVDVLQVFGGGTERTNVTIANAIGFIGTSAKCKLLFATGNWAIDSSLTIPANFANHVPAGCVFVVASTKTLAFSGPVHVEHSTWFSGAEGCVVTSKGASGFPGY